MIRADALAAALLVTILFGTELHSQSVRGRVTERGVGSAVAGALVVLIDGAGSEAAGTLTDRQGAYRVGAPAAGEYRLRVDRIGYESTWSTPVRLVERGAVELDLQISTAPIELTGIVVTQERRCTTGPETGLRTASVWAEARKALALAVAAGEVAGTRYRVRTFERELAPEDLRVRRERIRTRSGVGTQPYASVPAELLRDSGFVRAAADGTYYYAPDAPVLLSEAFLDTHCFHLTERTESGKRWIGLAFEPIRGRRTPDIEGTFWLDPASAALHLLEYEYTNVDHGRTRRRFGGRVEFERLPDGAWIVRRWRIRMPKLGRRASYDWTGQRHEVLELTGILEEGGEVVSLVTAGSEALRPAAGATLTGLVFDSTRAAPLAGAFVTVDGTEHAATTDSLGLYRIEDIPQGTYSVSFSHPRGDSLGLFSASPRTITVGSGEDTLPLGLPSLPNLRAALCDRADDSDRQREDSEEEIGILAGLVTDATAGAVVPGARVRVTWSGWDIRRDRSRPRVRIAESRAGAETLADSHGRYRLCGLPALVPISVRAAHLGLESRRVEVTLEDAEPVRLDLSLVEQPTGELRGRALDGRALHGVTTADVTVPRAPIVLEGVTVTGRSTRAEVERARSTSARLLDRSDIARLQAGARHLGDVLRAIPGLEVREGSHADSGICVEALRRMRSARTARGCEMVQVYLDGARLSAPGSVLVTMSPSDLESIELLSPAEAGLRFGTGAGTGALVIYSRGRGPYR